MRICRPGRILPHTRGSSTAKARRDQLLTTHHRCKTYLGEIIGDGPVKDCAANENDLDLGVLYENGENGCVQWFINAVKTTNW